MKLRLLNIAAEHIKTEVPYFDFQQSVAFAMIEIANKFTGTKLTERQEKNFLRKCGLHSGKVH